MLGASTGTDDTTWLNAALAAGGRFRGKPGETYLISAPLVVPSGAELDMRVCTIREKSGSNCNLLNNSAKLTTRRVLDAVTTASSTTMTSATAAFTGADTGKSITIQGAGAAGVPLTTTVTYVNSTTVTLAVAASTSVTGQYAAIGGRDSDITIVGGLWDRGTNLPNQGNASQVDSHLLCFRHVDGLRIADVTVTSAATGSKYGINAGDCTDVAVLRPRATTHYSDLVHLNGPCARVSIRDAVGDLMGDDLVSMTARDSTTVITDCAGDITDVLVDGAYLAGELGGGLTACALKVVAGKTTGGGASYNIRGLRARNLVSPTTTAAVVYIGDTSGGNITDVLVDGVRSLGGGALAFDTVYFGGAVPDDVRVRNVTADVTDRSVVNVSSNVTAGGRVIVENATMPTGGGSTGGGLVIVTGGVLAELVISRCSDKGASGRALLTVPTQTPHGQIAKVLISDSHLEVATGGSGAGAIRCQDGSATIGFVEISNLVAANSNYALGFYATTTTILARNVRSEGASLSSWLRAAATAVLTVYADGLSGTLDGVNIDSGGAVRCKSFGLPLDVGTTGITKAVGDAAYNTNAARACGVGPVVSDGTNWKGLFTGATF